MQIEENSVVTFHYTLSNDQGEVLESSKDSTPLAYIHGQGSIISGLEAALEGRQSGDKFNVRLEPSDAYGDRIDELVQTMPRSAFVDAEDLDVGMAFRALSEAGETIVHVVNVEGDDVTVDGNHPLAGQALTFDVEVEEVRQATDEELSHGHVHGPHGAHE
jgi:FKBP-type peptidyl-prolyl cis-trans isomerase SlyD